MTALLSSLGISIHAPREGGDNKVILTSQSTAISIHAPREGGDNFSFYSFIVSRTFQSTPPARGATSIISPTCGVKQISIHAPREGGDLQDTQ